MQLCSVNIAQCGTQRVMERGRNTLIHSTALDTWECHSALLGHKLQKAFQKLTLSAWINAHIKTQLPAGHLLTSGPGDKVH